MPWKVKGVGTEGIRWHEDSYVAVLHFGFKLLLCFVTCTFYFAPLQCQST